MASVTDWVSTSLLTVVGLAAATNVARGTFPQWLRAKTLLDAPPPSADIIPLEFGGFSGGVVGFDPDDGRGSGGGWPRPSPGPLPPGGEYGDPLPSGQMISPFGACRSGITCTGSCCRRHKGIDIAAPSGTPVYSIAAGRVARSGTGSGGCGLRVTVDHFDGTSAVYCHLAALIADTGQIVGSAGVPLGTVGTTGNAARTTPHLHFEIHRSGGAVDPAPLIGR